MIRSPRSERSTTAKEKTMLPKIDPSSIEVAFTQEKFDAAVARASVARQNLAVATGNLKAAQEFFNAAKEEAECARLGLRDLAFAAAGYGLYE
jgi:hypothetical protein